MGARAATTKRRRTVSSFPPLLCRWVADNGEPAFDQIGVIELTAADQRRRVMPPLVHRAGIVEAERPGEKPLARSVPGIDAVRAEGASRAAATGRVRSSPSSARE